LKYLLGGKGKGGVGGLFKNMKFGKLAKGTGIAGLVLTAFDLISESFDAYRRNPDAGVAHAIGEGVKQVAVDTWDLLSDISSGIWDFASGLTGIEEISSENIAKVDAKIAETISGWANEAVGFWDKLQLGPGPMESTSNLIKGIGDVSESQQLLSDTVAAARREWWQNIKDNIGGFFESTGEWLEEAITPDPNIVYVQRRLAMVPKFSRPIYVDGVTGPQQRYSEEIENGMNRQRRLQEEQRRARDTGQNGGGAIVHSPTYNSSSQTIILPSSPADTDPLINTIDRNNEAQ
jgi:hypothetical protein